MTQSGLIIIVDWKIFDYKLNINRIIFYLLIYQNASSDSHNR
jgi:hypothetical protein